MDYFANPHRPAGLTGLDDVPYPSTDAARVAERLARCPHAAATPLTALPDLAQELGVAQLHVKDERGRMGLGSFKALGAAYVIACDAETGDARGATYITASAGNHGLSVAAGAQAFGAAAHVYLSETVPESFAERLRGLGATVVRAGSTYEESMQAALDAREADPSLRLLSDTSWPGYTERPWRLMEGYVALMAEAIAEIDAAPTHIFLQAGVGGLAGAAAAMARKAWGDAPHIAVVEPEAAPALIASARAGRSVVTTGPVSAMGRLDCKEPSLIALKGLTRDADSFVTLTEAEGDAGAEKIARAGMPASPSGAAGFAALCAADGAMREALGLSAASRVMVILSEGPAA